METTAAAHGRPRLFNDAGPPSLALALTRKAGRNTMGCGGRGKGGAQPSGLWRVIQ